MQFKYIPAFKPAPITFAAGRTHQSGGEIQLHSSSITIKYCSGDYNENALLTQVCSGTDLPNKVAEFLDSLDFVSSVSINNSSIRFFCNVERFYMEVDKNNEFIPICANNINHLLLTEEVNNSTLLLDKYSLNDKINVDLSSDFRLQNFTDGQQIELKNAKIAKEGLYYKYKMHKYTVLPTTENVYDILEQPLSYKSTIPFIEDITHKQYITVSIISLRTVTPVFKAALYIEGRSNIYNLAIVDSKSRNGITDYTLELPYQIHNFNTEMKVYVQYVFKGDNPNYKSASYRFKRVGTDYKMLKFINKFGGWSYLTCNSSTKNTQMDDTEKYVGYDNFVPTSKILNVNIEVTRKIKIWCDKYEQDILRDLQKSKMIYETDSSGSEHLIEITKLEIEESSNNLIETIIEYNYTTENI